MVLVGAGVRWTYDACGGEKKNVFFVDYDDVLFVCPVYCRPGHHPFQPRPNLSLWPEREVWTRLKRVMSWAAVDGADE